jgi:hypothetical protein
MLQTSAILNKAAEELHIPEDDLIRKGLHSYLERQLRMVQVETFEITNRYNVSNVEDLEERYRDGTLEEADSWRDFQRLDHLEYKREQLQKLLEALS